MFDTHNGTGEDESSKTFGRPTAACDTADIADRSPNSRESRLRPAMSAVSIGPQCKLVDAAGTATVQTRKQASVSALFTTHRAD